MRNRILRFVIYGAVGVVTGLIVAGVVVLAEKVLLEDILHRSLWQQAIAPALDLPETCIFLKAHLNVGPLDIYNCHHHPHTIPTRTIHNPII